MRSIVGAAILALIAQIYPMKISAQTKAPPTTAPQPAPRGQRGAAKSQPALTLRQVIESLISLKSSARVETLISSRGVQFQGNAAVLDVLKEFGAGPKLLAMIPIPPPPKATTPPAPKFAGPLDIVCAPKDCDVTIDNVRKGTTSQSRKTISGLPAGEVTVQVFTEGHEIVTRRLQLQEGKPLEERFTLQQTRLAREQAARVSLLKALVSLGGTDGFAELGEIEGSGVLHWIDVDGQRQEWSMTFTKRIGRDLVMTFKTKDGQCSASILLQATKQECKGDLRRGGDKIADQATTLFLSYQLQDILQTLLKRPLILSESNENRLESSDVRDLYVLTLDKDGLPAELVYQMRETDSPPIYIQYSNYLNLSKSRYPARITMGRLNATPVWVFTVNSVRSRLSRGSN